MSYYDEPFDLAEEYGQLATPSDAVREFAWNEGMDRHEEAWLLHDWDVWVKNPHYTGPEVRHPEDDSHDGEVVAPDDVRVDVDDIPF